MEEERVFEERVQRRTRALYDCRAERSVAKVYPSGRAEIEGRFWEAEEIEVLVSFLSAGPLKVRYRVNRTFTFKPNQVGRLDGRYVEENEMLTDEDIETLRE